MDNIRIPAYNRNTGRIVDIPVLSDQRESPISSYVYMEDRSSLTLDNGNSRLDIIVNNMTGNSGVTTIYMDTKAEIGSKWNVQVIYGINGSMSDTPPPYTSLIVSYGANGVTIDSLANIADFQSILDVPDSSGVELFEGNVLPYRGGDKLIGIPNKTLYIDTVTKDSTYGPAGIGSAAIGVPTLSNYGVAISLIEIIYMGIFKNPTFIYNVSNTYYPVTGQ